MTDTLIELPLKSIRWRQWNDPPHHYETREVLAAAYRSGRGRMRTHTIAVAADGLELYHLCVVKHLADRNANPRGLADAPTCKTCRSHDPRFGGCDKEAPSRPSPETP